MERPDTNDITESTIFKRLYRDFVPPKPSTNRGRYASNSSNWFAVGDFYLSLIKNHLKEQYFLLIASVLQICTVGKSIHSNLCVVVSCHNTTLLFTLCMSYSSVAMKCSSAARCWLFAMTVYIPFAVQTYHNCMVMALLIAISHPFTHFLIGTRIIPFLCFGSSCWSWWMSMKNFSTWKKVDFYWPFCMVFFFVLFFQWTFSLVTINIWM